MLGEHNIYNYIVMLILSLFIAFFRAPVRAMDMASLQLQLQKFHQDPPKLPQAAPKKIESQHNLIRQKIMSAVVSNGRDNADKFFEGAGALKNIAQLEQQGLRTGSVSVTPWSDSYWPMYRGLIGARYADPGYPNARAWSKNYDYVQSNPASQLISAGQLDRLSPAEKYDLLVGDASQTFTQHMWKKGASYQAEFGSVPGWMGICHGWAGAAIAYPQPLKKVETVAANGMPLTFHPSDIKALASMIWATAPGPTHFVGDRCGVRRPDTDPVGRVTDENCFNTNPATWHVVMTNRVGLAKKSLVMDATYDFEVWNHPVQGYRIQYFNPQSLELVDKWQSAAVALGDFRIDKFKSYRAPETQRVVGVAMEVEYMVPLRASHHGGDRHMSKKVTYVYDLELGAGGDIVGGEWYTSVHPDFVWVGTSSSRAISAGDKQLQTPWDNLGAPLAPEIRSAALLSSRLGEPLAVIVEKLVQLSSSP